MCVGSQPDLMSVGRRAGAWCATHLCHAMWLSTGSGSSTIGTTAIARRHSNTSSWEMGLIAQLDSQERAEFAEIERLRP